MVPIWVSSNFGEFAYQILNHPPLKTLHLRFQGAQIRLNCTRRLMNLRLEVSRVHLLANFSCPFHHYRSLQGSFRGREEPRVHPLVPHPSGNPVNHHFQNIFNIYTLNIYNKNVFKTHKFLSVTNFLYKTYLKNNYSLILFQINYSIRYSIYIKVL